MRHEQAGQSYLCSPAMPCHAMSELTMGGFDPRERDGLNKKEEQQQSLLHQGPIHVKYRTAHLKNKSPASPLLGGLPAQAILSIFIQ
nr:unnamed protein product [Digitaria exilis]